jgi:hypothetical protein
MTKDDASKSYYHNANLPIVVPGINVILEDLLISGGFVLLGMSVAVIAMYISDFIAIFLEVMSFFIGIACVLYARHMRKAEIDQRGICRTGVLRRQLAYVLGADKLSGR